MKKASRIIPRRTNKYGNHRVNVGGETFDSEKEYARYRELQLLQKAGFISELERQKKFELQPAFYHQGRRIQAIFYVCDFFYRQEDKYIIEDVKSPGTQNNAVYKLKKKMMLYRGYEIKET